MMQRDYSYDILKGIGILLVLWGHTMTPAMLHNVIYTFHMPLFFFVSGAFFKNDTLSKIAKHKAKRLLGAWAVFFVLNSLTLGFTEYLKCRSMSGVLQFYKSDMLMGLVGNRDSVCVYGTIWFLICLFEVFFIYALLQRMAKLRMGGVTALCLVFYAVGYVLGRKDMELPYFLDTTMSVLIYFHIGHIFRVGCLDKKPLPAWLPAVGFAMFIIVAVLLNPHTEIRDNRFEWYILPLSMFGTINLFYLVRAVRIPQSGLPRRLYILLTTLGIESLVIFGFHRVVYYIAPALYLRIPLPDTILTINTDYIIGIVMIFATAMICLYISKVFHRFLPTCFGKQIKP